MPDESRSLNYKTVRLSKGKHASPQHGACVMELASMIAHEPFSDHPVSVSPVIAALLRTYNDTVGDERRQDLYHCAAKVIGTRDSATLERLRAQRCLWFARQMHHSHNPWVRGLRRVKSLGGSAAERPSAGAIAVKAIYRHTDETHARVMSLVDELCAMGSRRSPAGLLAPRVKTAEAIGDSNAVGAPLAEQ
jgi:hypothetical protein